MCRRASATARCFRGGASTWPTGRVASGVEDEGNGIEASARFPSQRLRKFRAIRPTSGVSTSPMCAIRTPGRRPNRQSRPLPLGTTTSALGERRQTAAFAGGFDSLRRDAGAHLGGLLSRRGRAETWTLLSTALDVVPGQERRSWRPRARSREGGRRVLSRWSPPHRAFIGRVLRDTRRRLHRERLPYAGGVPARGSLPYAASAWRGGQPALGVA